jgi:hypothetical protein
MHPLWIVVSAISVLATGTSTCRTLECWIPHRVREPRMLPELVQIERHGEVRPRG